MENRKDTNMNMLIRPIHIKNKVFILIFLTMGVYIFGSFSPISNVLGEFLAYFLFGIAIIIGVIRKIKGRQWQQLKLIGITILTIIVLGIAFNLILNNLTLTRANLKDDRTYFDIKLYKLGVFHDAVYIVGGFRENYYGRYSLAGDTIKFCSYPYDNDFIPLKLIKTKTHLLPIKNGIISDFGYDLEFNIEPYS
jgi:hypothetical protein